MNQRVARLEALLERVQRNRAADPRTAGSSSASSSGAVAASAPAAPRAASAPSPVASVPTPAPAPYSPPVPVRPSVPPPMTRRSPDDVSGVHTHDDELTPVSQPMPIPAAPVPPAQPISTPPPPARFSATPSEPPLELEVVDDEPELIIEDSEAPASAEVAAVGPETLDIPRLEPAQVPKVVRDNQRPAALTFGAMFERALALRPRR